MRPNYLYPALIALSAVVFFIPFLGAAHLFDWDEINFAESAREMLVTGNYSRVQINFQPFWEKPPLFFWLQAGCMHLLGVNEFAARLPNALMGIVTLLTLYFLGRKLYDEQFGLLWALSYLGSLLPHLYFKSGIIDPTFNYFIFLTVFLLARSVTAAGTPQAVRYAAVAGLAAGLAMLTKGPVGLLLVLLTTGVYWATTGFGKLTTFPNVLAFAGVCALVSSVWFGLEVLKHGPWFLQEFIQYQVALFRTPVAGHQEAIYYHFVVVFLGCFPISILALPVLSQSGKAPGREPIDFKKWMTILFWVVMILFTVVKTKIVHYSSLAYFPLSFLAAYFMHGLLRGTFAWKGYLTWLLGLVGGLVAVVLMLVPLVAQHQQVVLPYLRDAFAVACLSTPVAWSGYEWLIGLAYGLALAYAVWQLSRHGYMRGFVVLCYATATCLLLYLKAVVPRIESYSQGPAVAFYQRIARRDVYVSTVDFKSYAHYFYTQKMPGQDPRNNVSEWLMGGNIDKPAYLVVKTTDQAAMAPYPDCRLVGRGGGFLFYLRLPAHAR